jgi:lysophospholipase L1-like esterase
MLPRKAFLTAATLGLFLLALAAARVVTPFNAASVLEFHPRDLPQVAEAASVPVRPASKKAASVSKTPRATGTTPAPQAEAYAQLSDPQGALNAFYEALSQTETGHGVTRVLHYGDSPVTADSITADVRSLFQEHFGDAGHGFVLIAKPWAWYGHRGVEVHGSGWRIEPASQSRAKDGFHGLGGVSFRGEAGASSQIHLETPHARIEVAYLEQPAGGTFQISAGETVLGQVETAGDEKKPGWTAFPLPAGAQDIRLVVQSGSVRLFGASFEKDGTGVIYNSLGLNGGQVQVVLRYFEQGQWTAQMQHQHPDLVVVNYGTNESVFPEYIEHQYAGELREVIRRIQHALPEASLLVMSPMDRGQRDSDGTIRTVAILPRLVEIQQQVATEMGCAFFNTFQAMGGEGTMARWYSNQPRLVSADFMHPLPGGARKVGILLYDALTSGYEHYKWRKNQASAGNATAPRSMN